MGNSNATEQSMICFVSMSFGRKSNPFTGEMIDFDNVYEHAIRPSVLAAGLEPLRADEETTGGIIHQPMFSRLLTSDYCIFDLTLGEEKDECVRGHWGQRSSSSEGRVARLPRQESRLRHLARGSAGSNGWSAFPRRISGTDHRIRSSPRPGS